MFYATWRIVAWCSVGMLPLWVGCSSPTAPTAVAPLALTCPPPQHFQSLDGQPVLATYPQPVTSGGSGPVTITCTPASGTLLLVGTTQVTCTARTPRPETATCSFPAAVSPVPRLSATSILAFGDSITAGTIATTCPNGGEPTGVLPWDDLWLLRSDLNASSGQAYPDVLRDLLTSRYAAQSFTVVNRGEPGERATAGAMRLPAVLTESRPDVVLLLEGVNDINSLHSAGVPGVVTSLRTMIRVARQRGATVLVSTLLPQRRGACRALDYRDGVDDIETVNAQIRALTTEGAVIVDMHPLFVPQTTTWLGLDGLHPNEVGYAAMAQAMFDTLRSRFEVP